VVEDGPSVVSMVEIVVYLLGYIKLSLRWCNVLVYFELDGGVSWSG
jgi:hypothetical protein